MTSRRILVKQSLDLHRFLTTHLTDINIARIKSIIFIEMYGRNSFQSVQQIKKQTKFRLKKCKAKYIRKVFLGTNNSLKKSTKLYLNI